MNGMLAGLSGLSTLVISIACAVHLCLFLLLWRWARRDLRAMASSLDDFTRNLKHRSILDSTSHLSEQVEAFLADVNEVLGQPGRHEDRAALLSRMSTLDEKRKYLQSMLFETGYNVCRTMIEAYPLAGVLGTILAIGAALASGEPAAGGSAVSAIVERFGDAIWSTFAGLTAGILLMFVNSLVEPPFSRLAENRVHVRDTIAHAKRELALNPGEPA